MFFRKKISPKQTLSFLTEKTMLKLEKEMDNCYKQILKNKERIQYAEEKETSTIIKNRMIGCAEDSIKYFVQRRDSIFLAQSYIRDFSNEIEKHI